jgi:hypothetical protein
LPISFGFSLFLWFDVAVHFDLARRFSYKELLNRLFETKPNSHLKQSTTPLAQYNLQPSKPSTEQGHCYFMLFIF